ncbi:MAG: HlyD family type I secretion periplasmic adaptor subunit [Cyanobacteriota bacterium]
MLKTTDDGHEFKPILAEIEERPISPLGRATFWIIVIFIVFAILWMFFGKVDVVVSARGKIIPVGNIKILQPLETGVVKQILVKEGDYVKKGQVLMEVDPSTTEPELESLTQNLHYLELESDRLNATTEGTDFILDRAQILDDIEAMKVQKELYESSMRSLKKQLQAKNFELKKLDEQINSTHTEKNNNENLLEIALDKEQRLKQVIDLIAKKELDDVQANILTYNSKIKELDYKLKELNHEKSQIYEEIDYIKANFKETNLKELSDRQKQSTQIKANIKEIAFRNKKQNIVSPVDGYINMLFIHTVGGVVTPAEKLISVVPKNTPIVIKVNVLNKDIGFIEEGMDVQIKIDTFSFQKYGLLKGVVTQVSKDSIEDEKLGPVYEVYINPIDHTLLVEGKEVSISTGMSLTAEIKVGKRRIIEFFIYPLIKYLDEGISVR